ncbi:hypothetical protein DFH06DRAFT_1252661 [Mycena polygramma]|nr:hypothetical protein DFH06DRAFT_1252661 [Mycena polygramma]
MNLYLTLFTHLCVHLLGLMGNSALTLTFTIVAVLFYWIYLVLLRVFWPGRLLRDTFARIGAMETCLHDEARHRRTMDMYNLSTYGLRSLDALKRVHDSLYVEHYAHLHAPLSYLRGALSLYKRAQRCKDDVEVLCRKLDAKIQRFDNGHRDDDGDEPDMPHTRASWSDWVDTFLAPLFDQLTGR